MFALPRHTKPLTDNVPLTIRPATAGDLPQGCIWIEAGGIEDAVAQIKTRIVDGEAAMAIWVPPATEQNLRIQKFFAKAAGRIEPSSWSYVSYYSSSRSDTDYSAEMRRDFSARMAGPGARLFEKPFAHDRRDYELACTEIDTWAQALLSYLPARSFSLRMRSSDCYDALRSAYCIHDDALATNRNEKGALRLLVPFCGDTPFLYDMEDLDVCPSRSKEEQATVYKPHGTALRAWSPPVHAVTVFTNAAWGRKYPAIHSARGPVYAEHPQGRLLGEINLYMPL